MTLKREEITDRKKSKGVGEGRPNGRSLKKLKIGGKKTYTLKRITQVKVGQKWATPELPRKK